MKAGEEGGAGAGGGAGGGAAEGGAVRVRREVSRKDL